MSFENLSEKFAARAILPECKVSIVIPVRDEAENIENTLQALARQLDFDGKILDFAKFEILVLANNCTDNSFEIIENFRRANSFLNLHCAETSLPNENANIGFVRRMLMNTAFTRLQHTAEGDGVIMTTDGDTTTANDWIAANLREIEQGANAVGGRIIIPDSELAKLDDACRNIHLKDEEYRLLTAEIEALIDDLPFDDLPRHHQHFNGSFAVTAEIYEQAGGVPDVKYLEDCAFFDSLQRIDARVRHSPHVKVYTSARRVGRSEIGLSFQLEQWKTLCETGAGVFVEPAQSIIERFTARRDLRKLRQKFTGGETITPKSIEQIAGRIFVAPELIIEELEKTSAFGAFYENIMNRQHQNGEWLTKFPLVALAEAVTGLTREIKNFRVQSFAQTSMR